MGITLHVSTLGCGKPQEADEQQVDTRVFCYVVKRDIKESPNLGIIGQIVEVEVYL